MTGRRALITGVTGQDGSYLAELLLAKGYEVAGVVRDPARAAADRASATVAADGDLLDPRVAGAARSTRSRPHELYHLAAPTFVPASWEDPTRA